MEWGFAVVMLGLIALEKAVRAVAWSARRIDRACRRVAVRIGN